MRLHESVRGISITTGVLLLMSLVTPSGWAADGDPLEAATQTGVSDTAIDHIRAEIAAESDPELRAAMEEQLQLLESGQLDFQTIEREIPLGAPTGTAETSGTGGRLADTLPGGGIVGPPIDIGTGGGTTGGDYLPPEARAELEKIFSQGTGDPSKDGDLREQAEQVLEKYGIDHDSFGMMGYDREEGESGGRVGSYEGRQGEVTSPREAFQEWERSEEGQRTDPATREHYREMSEQYQAEFEERGEAEFEERGEGFERAMTEHMAPEAREQMERLYGEHEMEHEMEGHEAYRESFEQEQRGQESSREFESLERSSEAPAREYEAMTREYEAPTSSYEAPTHEYEVPQQTYEAPEHNYQQMEYLH